MIAGLSIDDIAEILAEVREAAYTSNDRLRYQGLHMTDAMLDGIARQTAFTHLNRMSFNEWLRHPGCGFLAFSKPSSPPYRTEEILDDIFGEGGYEIVARTDEGVQFSLGATLWWFMGEYGKGQGIYITSSFDQSNRPYCRFEPLNGDSMILVDLMHGMLTGAAEEGKRRNDTKHLIRQIRNISRNAKKA